MPFGMYYKLLFTCFLLCFPLKVRLAHYYAFYTGFHTEGEAYPRIFSFGGGGGMSSEPFRLMSSTPKINEKSCDLNDYTIQVVVRAKRAQLLLCFLNSLTLSTDRKEKCYLYICDYGTVSICQ